ncbi:alpha/beta hydrolase [Streptomyces sp. NPDC003374]
MTAVQDPDPTPGPGSPPGSDPTPGPEPAPGPRRTRGGRRRRTLSVLAGCALLPAALYPAAPAAAPSAARPAGADGTAAHSAADAGIPAELRRYYRQRLQWEPCPSRPSYQCATLDVPLDYARPRAGELQLTAARKKATGNGAGLGSLLVNPGGPGASAIDYLTGGGADVFSPSVRASYDLVALDPRGVQYSTPVLCESGTSSATLGTGRRVSAESTRLAASDAAYEQLTDACAQRAGKLLPHVGTLDAARDMDVLRALLGDERLHYVGFSYGTYLGATYAGLFPSRVGRMVLDGAVDPTIDGYQDFLDTARGFQVAWESFAADCAARADCPLGRSTGQIGRALDALRDRLDSTPLRQGKDISITGDDLLTAVVAGLEAPNWQLLRAALQGALKRDTTALQQLLAPATDTSSNAGDAFFAISCLSEPLAPRSTPAQVQAALGQFLRASPQFGKFYATQLMQCSHWPVRPVQPSGRVTAPGAAPILVLGTTRDPATPYPWAKALAAQLSSGRLLTYDADGHTAYHRGSACVDDAVDRYLAQGRLPAPGTVCTDQARPAAPPPE